MQPIVDFDHPPVVETVLSVGFAPIGGLTGAHVGEFWTDLRTDLPIIAERPPYEMPTERPIDGPPGLQLSVTPVPPSRYWLISEDDSRLLQVQRDWFAFNWRYRDGMPYETARYPARRDAFREYWDQFRSYVESNKLGGIEPRACEVTYINHVRMSGQGAEDLDRVLRFVSAPSFSTKAIGRIESWETSLSAMLLSQGKPAGRVHLSVRPIRVDGEPLWQVNLTARGKPLGRSDEGILNFLDLGHETIVINFKDITTDEKHEEWGLR